MATRIFAAYNAYLSVVQAALPDVTVYDGPQPTRPTNKDYVIVGCADPLSEGMVLAVDSGQQDWIALGPQRSRDETFTIRSTYVSWTGGNDLSGCRSRADTNISLIETAVRTDLTLGGALTSPGWCGISIDQLEQIQDTNGSAVHVLFSLACRARV